LIEDAINNKYESILLLEDDGTFVDQFTSKVQAFLERLPKDWGMIYLGGQHLFINSHPPEKVNEWVYRPFNVNRTHAFALHQSMMLKVYNHLCNNNWQRGNHIDHHLGRLHQRRQDPIYCPKEWLIGQAAGKSDISCRNVVNRIWRSSESIESVDPDTLPFVAVIGLHSSGSTLVGGILHKLGIFMGDHFIQGPWGTSYEAVGLAQICEGLASVTDTKLKGDGKRLIKWINTKRRQAYSQKQVAGGKYPILCALGEQLLEACKDNLYVVHVMRPLQHSILSLQRRFPKKKKQVAAHQKWLACKKQLIVEKAAHVCHVNYYDLLEHPQREVDRIAEFLPVDVTDQQVWTARQFIHPYKRHVA
jgi:hypothetical protein